MDFLDLLSLIIDNLSRRKARVALTAFGVVIGTASVVVLVSLAIGLQLNATKQLTGIGDLTRIDVYPTYGEPVESMAVKVGGSGVPQQQNLLTNSAIEEIQSLPGVVAVIPRDYLYGSAIMKYNRLENWVNLIGVDTGDVSFVGVEPQAGVNTLQKGTAIIGSMVTTGFYDPNWRPGREQPAPPDLLDQTVKLYIIKYNPDDGSEIRKSFQVRIAGILPETRGESDWSVYMNLDDIEKYNEWITGNKINRNKEGYSQVMVKVDNVKNVLDVTEKITELGYQAYTPQSFVEGINSFFLILQVIFGGVGAIALLVAAIGIANTMAMAILERTREIGLMKALGATNRDVLAVFLGESSGIGFLGGIGGVILGWSVGQVINVLALAYLAGQAAQQGGPPPSTAVYTPVWLPIFALIFATLIGLISGLYPALRAATLIPVTALKYE